MIKNILISSWINDELKEKLDFGIPITYVKSHELTNDLISRFDAYLGISLAEDIDTSNLKWIHCMAAGVDKMMKNKSLKESTIITHINEGFGHKMTEYVLARMLHENQRMDFYMDNQRNKTWSGIKSRCMKNDDVLIFGTGNIASKIAELIKPFVNNIYGISRSGKANINFNNIYSDISAVEDFFNIKTIVSTMPLTDSTYKYLNKDIFSRFNEAVFINIGRGKTVVEEDLITALKDGNLKSAYLDVVFDEPLNKSSELWINEKVYITPHCSASTDFNQAYQSIVKTYAAIINGDEITNKVDLKLGY